MSGDGEHEPNPANTIGNLLDKMLRSSQTLSLACKAAISELR